MDTESAVVLEVIDLAKQYHGREAVKGISFTIRAGEIYGLLGPNGAGKTTTIGMIATIISPSRGSVRISGHSTSSRSDIVRQGLGLVPQTPGLYPSLTAEENLRFFGRMYGVKGDKLEERVDTLLELTGLTPRRSDQVTTFSGGMKRRLNLACGLVHEPRLLLLDEPTVGVDPQSRERIFKDVEELASEGMAVIYTTHYMEEAERLCHRVAILDEGRLIAEGTVSELAGMLGEGGSIVVTFKRAPSKSLIDRLLERGARRDGADRFLWSGNTAEEIVPSLFQIAAAANNTIRELVVHRPNLGEVFLHLTGKELRD
jgi:ABC-2 type transport system ATP-binding protein